MIVNTDSPKTAEFCLPKIGPLSIGFGASWPTVMRNPSGKGAWLVLGLVNFLFWFGEKSKRIQFGPRLFGFGVFVFATWSKDKS